MSVNKIIFVGHLGRDPEVRYTANGDAVCNFSVASSEKWKDKATGEQQEHTEWLRCSAWGKLAEICGEYLQKGSLVYVEGKLQTRKFTDKEGVERYVTEARLDQMRMLGGRQDRDDGDGKRSAPQRQAEPQRSAPPARRPAPTQTGFDDMDDDIPF